MLLRIAVEYLTFHGNPVQQRCSTYSKGIWLLTHLHAVFRQAADNLEEKPAEDETRSRDTMGMRTPEYRTNIEKRLPPFGKSNYGELTNKQCIEN